MIDVFRLLQSAKIAELAGVIPSREMRVVMCLPPAPLMQLFREPMAVLLPPPAPRMRRAPMVIEVETTVHVHLDGRVAVD